MNDTLRLLRAHRSVRRFRPDPVDPALLAECVRSAQCASTSSHVQAYSLLRVTDPGERARLAELCGGQAQVAEAGAFFCVLGDARRHALACEDHGRPFVPNLETFLVATVDAALFAQNLALALESCGLGICYIGGLRNDLEAVGRLLELPEHVFPLFGLAAGHPAERPAPRARLPLELVLLEGRYPSDDEVRERLAPYDAEVAREYEGRGLAGRNWSGGVAAKFREARRTDLAPYYRSRGAVLE